MRRTATITVLLALSPSAPALAQDAPPEAEAPAPVVEEVSKRVKVTLRSGEVVIGTLLSREGGMVRVERASGNVLALPESVVSSVVALMPEEEQPADEPAARPKPKELPEPPPEPDAPPAPEVEDTPEAPEPKPVVPTFVPRRTDIDWETYRFPLDYKLKVFSSALLGQSLGFGIGALGSFTPALGLFTTLAGGTSGNALALWLLSQRSPYIYPPSTELHGEQRGNFEIGAGLVGSVAGLATSLLGVGIVAAGLNTDDERLAGVAFVTGGLIVVGGITVVGPGLSTRLYLNGVRAAAQSERDYRERDPPDPSEQSKLNLRPRITLGAAPTRGLRGGAVHLGVRF